MFNIFKKLVSFKTTADNPKEIKKAFSYIASLFDKNIFKIQNFEHNKKYSQLISFRDSNSLKQKFLLNGHLDVVQVDNDSQYTLTIKGDKAFGRGTSDMKGMIAVLVDVMQTLGQRKQKPDVALLITGDEEVGGENGAGYLAKTMRPKFVLCADGSSEKRKITTKEKGVLWLELEATGKSAHGAYLWEGENAVEKIIGAIEKIKKFAGKTKPKAWKPTMNLSLVETQNKTANKVPDKARAVLDIRFTEQLAKTPEELFLKIKKMVPEVSLSVLAKSSLLYVKKEDQLVQKFQRISSQFYGRSIPFGFEHGSTDARYFGELGIPAVVFGPVGGKWHSSGEWVDLKSLEIEKKILLEFLGAS